MPDFEKLEQEAQQAAQGHAGDVDKGIGDVEKQVDDRTGQSHDAQVEEAGKAAEKALGVDPQQAAGSQQPDPSQPPSQP